MKQVLRPRAPSPHLPALDPGQGWEGGILTGEEGEPKQSTDPSGPAGEFSVIMLKQKPTLPTKAVTHATPRAFTTIPQPHLQTNPHNKPWHL